MFVKLLKFPKDFILFVCRFSLCQHILFFSEFFIKTFSLWGIGVYCFSWIKLSRYSRFGPYLTHSPTHVFKIPKKSQGFNPFWTYLPLGTTHVFLIKKLVGFSKVFTLRGVISPCYVICSLFPLKIKGFPPSFLYISWQATHVC